jgi:N-acetylglucosamine-6-phosphate deacetylase
MHLIRAGGVVLDGKLCQPGWVQIAGWQIFTCGSGNPPRPPDQDFPNCIVVPGFIDMHVHGGGGASYVDGENIADAADFHLSHGTTTTMASLVTTSPEKLLASVRTLADATRAGTLAGIHLEGPWLSTARCGAHDPAHMRDPDPAEIDALLAAGDGAIRMVTLAPERPGSGEAIRRFKDAGVVVAVGHTDATYDLTRQAIALGATVGTHLFNAMPPLNHREPGAALALLEHPNVTVELIADGVHMHPAMALTAMRSAGTDRVALVTDAIAAAGSADGKYELGGVAIDVESGVARVHGADTIAGSTATMDQLFRTAAIQAGLEPAVRMTSATPARALGLKQVGELRAGYDANLVVLDRDLQITAVMRRGHWR